MHEQTGTGTIVHTERSATSRYLWPLAKVASVADHSISHTPIRFVSQRRSVFWGSSTC
jgi:hypothetical protein